MLSCYYDSYSSYYSCYSSYSCYYYCYFYYFYCHPRSMKSTFHQMLTGAGSRFNGGNRWFDKTVQVGGM